MKSLSAFIAVALLTATMMACSSGKTAYKHGDYYEAVLEAVQRLRQSPDNKRSKQVLQESYQAAVDFLNTDAQNQVASNANFKWKMVVQDYNKINNLYENIRTCPGALKVIPAPVSKYEELKSAKNSAAEECYNAGIQAMLKNTRDDAKQAFFLFTDANNFSPGYQESIEMIQQAKFNATLKILVQPPLQNYSQWSFEPVIFGTKVNEFVQFYTQQQIDEQKIAKIDHVLRVNVGGYQEGRPSVSRVIQTYSDSVKVGERTVNGIKIPVNQQITAKVTMMEKQISTMGSLQLVILNAASNAELSNSNIVSQLSWTDRWAFCSGDSRAIAGKMFRTPLDSLAGVPWPKAQGLRARSIGADSSKPHVAAQSGGAPSRPGGGPS